MKPEARDPSLFLTDIREAIDKILRYTADGREAFLTDSRTQDAVVRNLEIIGEAVKNLAEETRQAHPQVPWKRIAGLRDRIIHGYFRLDLELVWNVVEKELRPLRTEIETALHKR